MFLLACGIGHAPGCEWNPAILRGRRLGMLGLTLALAVLLSVASLGAWAEPAVALSAGQPITTGFPRLGLQWPQPAIQSVDEISRYDYVLLQEQDAPFIDAIRSRNHDAILMVSTNPCEIGLDVSESATATVNSRIYDVPNAWIQTQLGGNLTSSIDSASVTLPVTHPDRFRADDVVVMAPPSPSAPPPPGSPPLPPCSRFRALSTR